MVPNTVTEHGAVAGVPEAAQVAVSVTPCDSHVRGCQRPQISNSSRHRDRTDIHYSEPQSSYRCAGVVHEPPSHGERSVRTVRHRSQIAYPVRRRWSTEVRVEQQRRYRAVALDRVRQILRTGCSEALAGDSYRSSRVDEDEVVVVYIRVND